MIELTKTSRGRFRSDAEHWFALWLEEGVSAGFVKHWDYEPETFEIIPKATITEHRIGVKGNLLKPKVNSMFQKTEYTPDFDFIIDRKAVEQFGGMFRKSIIAAKDRPDVYSKTFTGVKCPDGYLRVVVDVKGSYDPHKGDNRAFMMKAKLLFAQTNVYTEMVITEKLFAKSYAPLGFALKADGKSLRKRAKGMKFVCDVKV